MSRRIITIISASLLSLAPLAAGASAPTVTPELVSPLPEGFLARASAMARVGNYVGALDQLDGLQRSVLSPAELEEADFMYARLSYLNGDPSCVRSLEAFASAYPASSHALEARLLAADYYFFDHEFAPALERYNDIDFAALGGNARPEYEFRKALSMVRCGYFSEADALFRSLRSSSRFGEAATYYIAYIDYVEGDYEAAEKGFLSLPDAMPQAGASRAVKRDYISDGIEPAYYLTQIEFLRADYDAVIAHGRALLARKPVPELIPETLRVIGESYYKKGDYDSAAQYLERYLDNGIDTSEPSARYALATIFFARGDYEDAANLFATLTDENNVLAQSSWLYLGQCAVKNGDDRAAAIAFDRAYRLRFSDSICETALYDYAAALMRGGNVPFASSAAALERFLAQYPRSTYAPQVRAILGAAYSRQGDYATALSYLEKIERPDSRALLLKQKVLFELGCEEVSTGRYADAATHLAKASAMNSDPEIARQALIWLGDARYSLRDYKGAESAYRSFIKGGAREENYALGIYNLAYTLYQQDKFAEASKLFAQATTLGLPARQADNARLRQADCLFYSRDFAEAAKIYKQVIDAGSAGADYATLRHATIRGLLGDIPGKLSELEQLSRKYPGSEFDAAAMLETGVTLADQGRLQEARTTYRRLADEYSDRPEARRALLNLALSSASAGDSDAAAEAYKEIISRWPSSPEAATACEDLAAIHASRGTLREYADWLASVPGAPSISVSEIEQLSFNAALDAYAADNSDTRRLQLYLDEYPDGANIAQALIYIAESKLSAADYKSAMAAARRILSDRPDSEQADRAMLIVADVLENHDTGRNARSEAYRTYSSLLAKGNPEFMAEALAGMMRTTTSDEERVKLARRLQDGGAAPELAEQAPYYEAMGLLKTEPKAGAEILRRLCANPKSLYGAKAAVALGRYYLDNKQYAAAEKVLVKFTDSGSPHDYQIAEGFIALADVYSAQGKKSLAKEYLISLRDNYPGDEPEIMSQINSRLSSLK